MLEQLCQIRSDWTEQQVYDLLGKPDRDGEASVVAEAYYSSSVGGVTVSAKETWGSTGDYSYLQAVNTPWEKYKEHYNTLSNEYEELKQKIEKIDTKLKNKRV